MHQTHREIVFTAIALCAIALTSLTACGLCGGPSHGDTAADRDSGAERFETGDTGAPVEF